MNHFPTEKDRSSKRNFKKSNSEALFPHMKESLVRKMILNPNDAEPSISCFEVQPFQEDSSIQNCEFAYSKELEPNNYSENPHFQSPKAISDVLNCNEEIHAVINQRLSFSSDSGEFQDGIGSKEMIDENAQHSYVENRQNENLMNDLSINQRGSKNGDLSERFIIDMKESRGIDMEVKVQEESYDYEFYLQHGQYPMRESVDSVKLQNENIDDNNISNTFVKQQEIEEDEYTEARQSALNFGRGKNKQIKKPASQRSIGEPRSSKKIREKRDNSQFEHINTYIELNGFYNLIEEMFTVYTPCELFSECMDFDSEEEIEQQNIERKKETELEAQQEIEKVTSKIIQSSEDRLQKQTPQMEDRGLIDQSQQGPKVEKAEEYGVKIQEDEYEFEQDECQGSGLKCKGDISQSAMFKMMEELRINEAALQEKDQVKKQIAFERSRIYQQYFNTIQILKPCFKDLTEEEKLMMIEIKDSLKENKALIEHYEKKTFNNNEHICKVCGDQFENGRQLGGHVSRKHPGMTLEYNSKKELYRVKTVERERRNYFKRIKGERGQKAMMA